LHNKETYSEVIQQDTHFKITGNDVTREYEYFISNSRGDVVESGTVSGRLPYINYISSEIIEIRFHGGTYADLCRYYNITSDMISADFWNPFLLTDGMIVYHDVESKILVVQDVFNKDVFYKTFPIDMIFTGHPESVDIMDNGQKLKMKYMKQSDYEYETQIFDLVG